MIISDTLKTPQPWPATTYLDKLSYQIAAIK